MAFERLFCCRWHSGSYDGGIAFQRKVDTCNFWFIAGSAFQIDMMNILEPQVFFHYDRGIGANYSFFITISSPPEARCTKPIYEP